MTPDLLFLLVAVLVGLVMIPIGLPGIWVMLLAGVLHQSFMAPPTIGWVTLGIVAGIGLVAEWLELWISGRYTKKYGGSRRAAWGAVVGGMAGAVVGVPIPMIGSVIGAFAGAFVGALVGEYSLERDHGRATRAATGAVIGRAVATALKSLAGCMIGVWLLASAWH